MPNYEYHNYTDIYNKLTNDEIKKDCYTLNSDECLQCSNCGIGIKNNSASCYPGDVYGPLFDYSMDTWIYNNDYDNYIFGELSGPLGPSKGANIISAYKPWNQDYKNIIADPIAMATLQ